MTQCPGTITFDNSSLWISVELCHKALYKQKVQIDSRVFHTTLLEQNAFSDFQVITLVTEFIMAS